MRRFADRIKAILLLDSGWTYEEVAEALFIDDTTVRRYHNAFEAEGVTGLVKDAYRGGISKLTALEEHELKDHLTEVTYASTKEIIAYVEEEYDVEFSIGGMRHLLTRLGFSYIKPKVVPGKANPEKQREFIVSYEALKGSLETSDRIYFADAAHPIHNAVAGYGWMPKGNPRELKTNSGRHRINLSGAVDPLSLDIVMRQEESVTSQSVIKLLAQLEAKHLDAKTIYFICDNAGYYTSKAVSEWVETSRIKMVYLPPYSPNLNVIERLWKYFRAQVMANIYYPTFAEFRHASSEFFRLIRHRKHALRSLLTDNFEILGFT